VVKLSRRILDLGVLRAFACWLTALYIKLVHATGRWRTVGGEIPDAYWQRNEPFILAFWHGRLLMMPYVWQQGRAMNMLISQHRDGELIARTISHFDLGAVRGSPKSGGAAALRTMIRSLKAGEWVGVTPDGPRGPRMRSSDGVISVARLSGVAVIPATYAARRRRVLNTWDSFTIPLPFTEGVFLWGEPLHVPRDAGEDATEASRRQLEDRLNALTAEADRLCGQEPVAPAPLSAAKAS
jgi:lysophospholipid acyltransferase (LPLAT)-like uncharacterized protein